MCGRGSVLLVALDTLLCFLCAMDDVIFARNGPDGGMSTPLLRVTSMRRRAQADAPAASYWSRRFLDGGRRRD